MTAPSTFKRKNIRLSTGNYRGRRLYLITLCFHDRQCFGGSSRIAHWLIGRLRKHATGADHFIHAYCVMPDHVHILAGGASETSNLVKFVESFKQETAVEFARRTRRRLWQKKYYDCILRGSDSMDRVASYIWSNPVRKGLCAVPADYPFLGSFTEVGARLVKVPAATDWMPPWNTAATKANQEQFERREQVPR